MSPVAIIPAGLPIILCADDYGISEAVSAGIEELADAGRLSATSCMVTFPEWPRLAARLAGLRERIAIGLHINLTVGAPLRPMPKLAPAGVLPSIGALTLTGGRGGTDTAELATEVTRQLNQFALYTGFVPDFVDGHQHAHVLPGVRKGVLAALRRFGGAQLLLVRDPSDDLARIIKRGVCRTKAMQIAALAIGFGKAARSAGLMTNAGFSGFSDFDPQTPYADELRAGFTEPGPLHLMMCHPGHVDAELAARDKVTERREQEYAALMAADGLTARLWRPDRARAMLWEPANA